MNKNLAKFFINLNVFKKCLELENNQLKCDNYFHFISEVGHFWVPIPFKNY